MRDDDGNLALPDGWEQSDFSGVDLAYDHALACEDDLESTFQSQGNAAGFVVATSGALVGLLSRQDPSGWYAAAAAAAFVALLAGLIARFPGTWKVRGEGDAEWETADATALKRSLLLASRERSQDNAKRLREQAQVLKASFLFLCAATALSAVQLFILAFTQ